MKIKLFFFTLAALLAVSGFSQYKKFDSTVKIGKAGYRVVCSNKSPGQNYVSLKLIGFDNSNGGGGDINMNVQGRIKKIEIDDFNNDGYPDLVMYVFSGANGETGNVLGISSVENKSLKSIYFPDIRDDSKLYDGYKGYDDFYLLNGVLCRSFPVYKKEDSVGEPTGGKRVIQYGVVPGDGNFLKFKVLRSYEEKNN